MDKKKIFVVLLLIITSISIYFYSIESETVEAEKAETELKLSGNVDVREVSLAFRQSDRVSEILVEEGDSVKIGQLLAKLESQELKLQIANAKTQIKMQENAVLRLHNGNRPEDIAQYEAKVRAAQSELDDALQHFERIQNVYDETQGSAITREELTTAKLKYTNKLAKLEESQQAYNLAAALIHESKILFLDEPTSGIDPLAQRDFWRQITDLSAKGTTIISTTHFMEEAEYCARIMIQDQGKLLVIGTPQEIKKFGSEFSTMNEIFISIVEKSRAEK